MTLFWIPGHEGECSHCPSWQADCPELFYGVNISFKNNMSRKWLENWLFDYRRDEKSMRQAKRLINPKRIIVETILNFSTKVIKIYTEVTTGTMYSVATLIKWDGETLTPSDFAMNPWKQLIIYYSPALQLKDAKFAILAP